MGYVEGKCPQCGRKVRESCNAWVYGSPIRKCPHCGSEYLDKRWRELAIEGADPRTKDPKFYLKMAAIFLIFTIGCILWRSYLIASQGSYPTKLLGCIILGAFATVGCVVVFFRIITGYESKNNAKYLEESKERLKDKAYVEKLISYGYDVPDEYRQ